MTSETIELAKKLISRPSITPKDENCQDILSSRLSLMQFNIEHLPQADVTNLYAKKGNNEPVLLFAGHTDVVPPGDLQKWRYPPFSPTIDNNRLFGRGAADMKSSLAAMVCSCEIFLKKYPNHKGSIAFLITSDEEGQAIHGTRYVVNQLLQRKEKITWCIVGEASSENQFGDIVKIGRRGSLNGSLIIHGEQGHIAYPQKASNPIHRSLRALDELCKTLWDQGNDYFPPSSFQISNLHAGTGRNNVIPGSLEVLFNFRFSSDVTPDQLQQRVHEILDNYGLQYTLQWQVSGDPFISELGDLFTATSKAIEKIMGIKPHPSTTGGTSDGRFITKMGCEIVEVGPINESIHKINENITLEELNMLTQVYYEIMVSLLT